MERSTRRRGGEARKSFSGQSLSTFRVLEREGALVGCPLVDASAGGGGSGGGGGGKGAARTPPRRRQPIPFTAEAMELTHLLVLERPALVAALGAMFSSEAAAARRAIAQAHKMHLDSLKLDVPPALALAAAAEPDDASRSGADGNGPAAFSAPLSPRTASALASGREQLLDALRGMRTDTASLPELLAKLQSRRSILRSQLR